jgi:hypothetical protein
MATINSRRIAQTALVVTGSIGLSSAAVFVSGEFSEKPDVLVHRAVSNSGTVPKVTVFTNQSNLSARESRSQSYFWTEKWQAGEKAADEDLAAERYETFESAEDAIDWLFGDDG